MPKAKREFPEFRIRQVPPDLIDKVKGISKKKKRNISQQAIVLLENAIKHKLLD